MTTIRDKAMLAELNVSRWTARKHDRKASKEVAQAHGANGDSDTIGRYNKLLIAKEALGEIDKLTSRARHTHYFFTLPWHDKGARLLPAKMFTDYTGAMGDIRAEFEAAVAKFIEQYPALVEEARERLNGLFNEDDYPRVGEIASRFGFDVELMPMPDADDFRVDLGDENVTRIKAEIEKRVTARLTGSLDDVWQRVHDAVKHISTRMREYDPNAKGKLHETVIGNLVDLVAVLPALNFTDDPALEEIRRRLEGELCTVTTKELKEDAKKRRETKAKADALLAALGAARG